VPVSKSSENNSSENKKSAWTFALRALRHRNYRLFFGGQSVSLIGTWMTKVATSWLVYRLTGSAWLLGITGFAGQIPTFILAPFAGVWVDRWDRHRTLVVTQILSMVQSFALAGLALARIITIPEIVWLSIAQGVINAFDIPARQSFVVEMIDGREDLSNAIALNSSMVTAARLLGPSIAGVLIAGVGEGYCFLIDGGSYIAVIASLLLMKLKDRVPVEHKARAMWVDLREGWSYVAHSVPIRSVLILLAMISLVGMPYVVLMPIFAGSVLHGGPHTMGFLMGASGVGALAAALFLAARKTVLGLGRIIPISAAIFGVGLIGFSLSRVLWVSLFLMVLTGAGMMEQMAASNTILQTIVDDDKRGRVMSFYSMAFMGMAPFGSLLAGAAATRIGAPATLLIGGAFCIAGSLWFASNLPAIRDAVRPIYRRMGILPEIAKAIETASVLHASPED
jgi:MFS family permease